MAELHRNLTLMRKGCVRGEGGIGTSYILLGATIDTFFTLDEHFRDILAKAQLAQGKLRKASACSWGSVVGVLRMTHEAVITSPLRYSLAVTGSCLPPDLAKTLNTQVVTIAARKVGGRSRAVRNESLHFLLGTRAAHKLRGVS